MRGNGRPDGAVFPGQGLLGHGLENRFGRREGLMVATTSDRPLDRAAAWAGIGKLGQYAGVAASIGPHNPSARVHHEGTRSGHRRRPAAGRGPALECGHHLRVRAVEPAPRKTPVVRRSRLASLASPARKADRRRRPTLDVDDAPATVARSSWPSTSRSRPSTRSGVMGRARFATSRYSPPIHPVTSTPAY
jgi:hypothetical protein